MVLVVLLQLIYLFVLMAVPLLFDIISVGLTNVPIWWNDVSKLLQEMETFWNLFHIFLVVFFIMRNLYWSFECVLVCHMDAVVTT